MTERPPAPTHPVFLYKIHAGYDGFTPKKIPDRLVDGLLPLGWQLYLDEVELGDEVWVYFRGVRPEAVYATGLIKQIDRDRRIVYLKVRESDARAAVLDETTSRRVGVIVTGQRGRQVFRLPSDSLGEEARRCRSTDCEKRKCGRCPRFLELPRVEEPFLRKPSRLGYRAGSAITEFLPAFWSATRRSFLIAAPYRSNFGHNTETVLGDLKTGAHGRAYMFALGIYERLKRLKLLEFDAIVPVPLSPDKIERKELHRTLTIAAQLSRLLGGTPVLEVLALTGPISKRALQSSEGLSAGEFERRYEGLLSVSTELTEIDAKRILLVDDVCTHGSTLTVCALKLRSVDPSLTITAVAGAQMLIKEAVSNPAMLLGTLTSADGV
jgi:hypothetical protein